MVELICHGVVDSVKQAAFDEAVRGYAKTSLLPSFLSLSANLLYPRTTIIAFIYHNHIALAPQLIRKLPSQS
jgi:hypothetical protein